MGSCGNPLVITSIFSAKKEAGSSADNVVWGGKGWKFDKKREE